MSVSASPRPWRRLRFVPLGIGAVALLFGLWTGLARLGLLLPGGTPDMAEFHGALMVCGFLGTLISLERAVAIGRSWAYAAPGLAVAGTLALLAGAPSVAAMAFLLAGLALTIDSIAVVVRQPALFTVMLAVAAACWAVGTAEWIAGREIAVASGWWLDFLVLTIVAERLELSRLMVPPPASQAIFAFATALLIVGAARGEFAAGPAPFSGIGLIASTVWLTTYDIAMRTIRQSGQARFSAACMLAGYVWLAAAGFLLILVPPGTAAFTYDAAVHAITIGFVLSMILGHAAIILPALTGVRVRYTSALYVPLALLHLSVLIRVAADLFEWTNVRALSGPVTVIALAGYAAVLVAAPRKKRPL